MGDLEYIESKVVAGDYFQVSGDIDNLNDTIVYVVPNGQTAFMIEAKIIITNHPGLAAFTSATTQNTLAQSRVRADFIIDTSVKDTTNIGVASNMSNNGNNTLTSGRVVPRVPCWDDMQSNF